MNKFTLISLLFTTILSFEVYSQDITYAEYFIDYDPGLGSAQPIENIELGEEQALLLDLAENLSLGWHQIGIRTKDAYSWSQTNFVSLLILEPDDFNPVSDVEYFLGADPGFDDPVCNDTVFDQSVVDLQDGTIAVKIPSNITPGEYLLFMRSRDGNGQYAHTQLVNDIKVCSDSYLNMISETAFCDYTSPSGMVLTESGDYRDFVSTLAECDSSYIIQLTIESIDTSVYLEDETLFAEYKTASYYQWIDCDNGNSPVPDADSSSFNPDKSGNYAVIVSEDDCTDTSNCHQVIIGAINEEGQGELTIHPNPNSGNFSVKLRDVQNAELRIFNLLGKVLIEKHVINEDETQVALDAPPGIYILKAVNNNRSYMAKILIR